MTEKHLEQQLNQFKETLDHYINGNVSESELKKTSAPLGIYQQKNKLFMLRIRITGGIIPRDELTAISHICRDKSVNQIHLTTRQDIQLHDISMINWNVYIDMQPGKG